MIFFVVLIILLGLFIYYDPYIDITENQILFWYNKKDNREYIILWKK